LNALALLSHASKLAKQSRSLPPSEADKSRPQTLEVTPDDAAALQNHVQAQVHRLQALAELEKFHTNAAIAQKDKKTSAAPVIERLNDYPTPGTNVDLENLVAYPPRIEPVPVKPLFFDVAWNYIDYPGRAKRDVEQAASKVTSEHKGVSGGAAKQETKQQPPAEEKKKGWFGFGR